MKIPIGINKTTGECVSFEKLICPHCFKKIDWDSFYPKVDEFDILTTDASATNNFICPYCQKTMSVSLNVLVLSERK